MAALGIASSFDTIKPYLLEETYELLEAIDNRDWPGLADEPGDLMLLRCSTRCQEDRVWRTPTRRRSGLPTTHCAAYQIRFCCRHGAPRGAKCYRDNGSGEAPPVLPRLARISRCCRVETTG